MTRLTPRRLVLAAAVLVAVSAVLISQLVTGLPAEPQAVTTALPVLASGQSFVPQVPKGGVFGNASFWRQSLVGAPVAANSKAMVAGLARDVAAHYNGIAALNIWDYNASVYTVAASVPRVNVRWDNCQGKTYTPAGLLGPGGQFSQAPIPAKAVPASGSDSELSVYSPSTDQLWEFWQMHHRSDGWHACWGGRIDGVSTSPGYFLGGFGVAASGVAFAEPVSINDIRSGVINHAVPIAIASPANWSNFSWPAQRSDGGDLSANAIPEGTRLRLPAAIHVSTLPLTPLARMVATAAQRYGMVVVDHAGADAVIAESGNGEQALTGKNPWVALLGGVPAYAQLQNFPWDKLQAIRRNYGEPVKASS